jgi:hypothetical protein
MTVERDIKRAYQKQERQIEQARVQQLAEVEKEAKEVETGIRRYASETERQVQEAKQEARTVERKEQRKRDLPYTKPKPTGLVEKMIAIDSSNAEAKTEVMKAKLQLAKVKKEQEDLVNQAADLSVAESRKAKDKALTEYRKAYNAYTKELAAIEANYIKLDSGEYVDKKVFEDLTSKQQRQLSRLGIDKFNKAQEEYADYIKANTITLKTGETVDKTEFDKLNAVDKAYLNLKGIDMFNKWKEDTTKRFEAENVEIKPEVWVNKAVWNELTPKQKQSVIATGEYTTGATGIPMTGRAAQTIPAPTKKAGSITPQIVWSNIVAFLGSQFNKMPFASPDIPSQEELKAQYQSESTAPLWSRLLFGTTVVKDPKKDEYYPVVIGEPPMISSAGSGLRIARPALKTIEINWNKFVSPSVIKPQVNWNEITKAINLGKIRNAAEAARWAAAQEKWFPKTNLKPGSATYQALIKAQTEKGIKLAAQAAANARALEAVTAGRIALIPQPNVPVTQWKPFLPSQLTVGRMKELIAGWQAMQPSKAIENILAANLVTAAIATNAQAISSIISKVNSATQAKVLSTLAPAIKQAMEAQQLTKAQTLAKTQVQAAVQTQTLIQQAVELAQKLATQGMTEAQVQAAVQSQLQLQTQAITDTQVRTQVRNALQPVTETSPQTQPVTQVVTTTTTTPRPVTPTPTPKPGKPTKPPKPPKPGKFFIPSLSGKHKLKDLTLQEREGAVAWKQGFIYILIYPPYGQANVIYSRKPFAGIPLYKGARSAYNSIIHKGSKLPPKISRDMGIMDIHIKTTGGEKPKLTFKRDIHQKTKLGKLHKPAKKSETQLMIVKLIGK